jgi:prepilin-type processing-associated H-X9-DG protein
VFGQRCPLGFSPWNVAWDNAGGGMLRMQGISDGTSNTMAIIEKPMVTGVGPFSYHNWALNGNSGSQQGGVNMWAMSDMPPEGLPMFGTACNDPAQTWDDEYGQWWVGSCQFSTGAPEFFHPLRRRLVPAQQNVYTIYPYHSSGAQVLLCDGSVRNMSTNISVQAWSAAITPAGGEVNALDQ